MFKPVPAGLESAAGDDTAMSALRLSAVALADGTDWSRLDDHAVIAQCLAAQAQGRLAPQAHPAPQLYRLAPASVSAAAAAPSPPAPAPSPRAAPAAPALEAETTFSLNIDVASMVGALQQAAQDGVPFCEECARAAAARQQAAA